MSLISVVDLNDAATFIKRGYEGGAQKSDPAARDHV
jgi:hypothetical protein